MLRQQFKYNKKEQITIKTNIKTHVMSFLAGEAERTAALLPPPSRPRSWPTRRCRRSTSSSRGPSSSSDPSKTASTTTSCERYATLWLAFIRALLTLIQSDLAWYSMIHGARGPSIAMKNGKDLIYRMFHVVVEYIMLTFDWVLSFRNYTAFRIRSFAIHILLCFPSWSRQ